MISGPIQVYPPGLLGFLQIKNRGENPSLLPDTIQSVMDLTEWMFQARAEDYQPDIAHQRTLTTNQNSLRAFTPNDITVPKGEWWWVHSFSIVAPVSTAGDSVNFACGISTTSIGANEHIVSDYQVGTAPNDACGVTANRFFVPPGTIFGVRPKSITSPGGITFTGYLRITRLPI